MNREALVQITQNVWTTLLGYAVVPTTAGTDPMELEATIRIDGKHSQILRISMGRTAARSVTAEMLGCEPAETSPEDVEDALGELANVIGGGLKSSLPGFTRLGLPRVARVRGRNEVSADAEQVRFDGNGAAFVVTLEPGARCRKRGMRIEPANPTSAPDFVQFLLERGVIDADCAARARRRCRSERRPLGQILVLNGYLAVGQVMAVLEAQVDEPQKRFGEIAIERGYITRAELEVALLRQRSEEKHQLEVLLEERGMAEPSLREAIIAYVQLLESAEQPMAA